MKAPTSEYENRYRRVREMMEKGDYDALIAYSNYKLQGNVNYLSGYVTTFGGFQSIGGTETVNFGSAAVVVPLEGDPMLLTDLVWDALRASDVSYIKDVRGSLDFAQDIYDFLKGKKIRKVGIDPWFVFPAPIYLKLKELMPEVTFERCRIMEEVRMIKSAYEIECLREAERITDLGCQAGLEAFVEGASERDVQLACEYVMRKYGESHLGTPSIIAIGAEATALGSNLASDRKAKKGDLLMIDIGARYKNYCGDISRAKVCGGDPTPAQQRLFNATLAMNREVIKAIKPGVLASDLHKLAVQVSYEYGYKDENNILLTGHGVGLDIHERPDYGLEETPLAENMVITVEPCLLEPGVGGVRIEDLVLVTANGAEVLSKTPCSLV